MNAESTIMPVISLLARECELYVTVESLNVIWVEGVKISRVFATNDYVISFSGQVNLDRTIALSYGYNIQTVARMASKLSMEARRGEWFDIKTEADHNRPKRERLNE